MKNQIWIVAVMAAVAGFVLVPDAGHAAAATVQADSPGAGGHSGGPGEAGAEEGRVWFHGPGAGDRAEAGEASASQCSFEADRFRLPEEARVLVAVEGTGGSNCRVSAFEKVEGVWVRRLETPGALGANGMSNDRWEGDKTTPIGVFRMNTPFGQKEALEGFPSNYIRVGGSHVWTQDTNRLVEDSSRKGEHVGSAGYAGYYDYVIDAGYNPQGILNRGSALFLHCTGQNGAYTSGCVAIPTDQMITVMKLYGTYGDGACYMAQAPEGTFDQIYEAYGVNQGLSPEGNFGSRQTDAGYKK